MKAFSIFRHVVLTHSPTISYNWYGGVVDAIYRARKGLVTGEEVKKQVSIVAYGINSAAQVLKLSPIEWSVRIFQNTQLNCCVDWGSFHPELKRLIRQNIKE